MNKLSSFLGTQLTLFNKMPLAKILSVALATALVSQAQPPAAGANKFMGNITSRGQVRDDFGEYWNQITAENEHKWGSVERTRDQMSWSGGDRVRDYAEDAGILWKFHTLVWGSQYPSWITGLSESEQLEEIEEWFDLAAARYPNLPMIDVVNEAHPNHAPAPFRNALGGNGSSGYEWIITAFEMARERWPNAILIYNDYNNIEQRNENDWTRDLVETMLERGVPIDAIGCQAHGIARMNASTVEGYIDNLAETGLPIFITEFDINDGNDNSQLNAMQDHFTMMWNHPAVAGITLWGYIEGQTWLTNSGLMSSTGDERPAMTWLVDFVRDNPNPPNDFPDFLNDGNTRIMNPNNYLNLEAFDATKGNVAIYDLQGREIPINFGTLTERKSAGQIPDQPLVIYNGASAKIVR